MIIFLEIFSMLNMSQKKWNPNFFFFLKITEKSFAECMTTVLATLQCRR